MESKDLGKKGDLLAWVSPHHCINRFLGPCRGVWGEGVVCCHITFFCSPHHSLSPVNLDLPATPQSGLVMLSAPPHPQTHQGPLRPLVLLWQVTIKSMQWVAVSPFLQNKTDRKISDCIRMW